MFSARMWKGFGCGALIAGGIWQLSMGPASVSFIVAGVCLAIGFYKES